ncbi:MAG: polysaccharide deacetylase family protein [Bacilli bacterium]|nr:polysaccharide deacetylase family protein [Bacilli bacterium]
MRQKIRSLERERKKQIEVSNKRKRQKIYKDKIEKKFIDIESELENDFVKIEKEINKELDKDFVELGNEIKKEVNKKKNKFNYESLLTGTVLVLSVMVLLCIIFLPVISFKENNIKIRYNKKFVDHDYRAKSLVKDYTKSLKITNDVDTTKIGIYKIKYSLKFGFLTLSREKEVEVIDDVKPIITLTGDNTSSVCPGKKYEELGFKASDEYDGDLTDKVRVENKKNEIIYKVKDKSNNSEMVMRKIVYEDKEGPKLELKGNSNMVVYVGSLYSEPGYSAIDNCDGDVTSKVEVSGSVNTNDIGTYTINYKIKDSYQNETIVSRTVTVKDGASDGGSGRGIVYLTFDDGPNEGTTNVILDVLKEEGVPATFFVTCNGPDYLISRMYKEGHTVALHTATHNYNYLYSSIDNYFKDLGEVSNRVERLTGIKSKIIRFPGGSSNTISKHLSAGIMTKLTSEVRKRGYKYFDWNVDSNDAAGAGTSAVYSNVVNNISLSRENVVLMHDIKTTTRDAIRNIIRYGKNNGFVFKRITDDTVMVTHGVSN